ncbi:carbohydrate-binding protein [Andreprevotia chitinilytica]|uniref:carbohydrate-binding protein n=1 Tax=Andreprevotia chitinilytica TaxID=396808 RepID=UPI000A070B67|nr:carbohydrate-binding protein [Andreprevotia chitinilytica]
MRACTKFALVALPVLAATGAIAATYPAWGPDTYYAAGTIVFYNGHNYQALVNQTDFSSAGWNPTLNSLWTDLGADHSSTPTPAPVITPVPDATLTPVLTPRPSGAPAVGDFVFSVYKDIALNMDWNTAAISTTVAGTRQPVVNVMPSRLKTLTWAFAVGECGFESWGGPLPNTIANANIQRFLSNGKTYVISTGSTSGAFTCGSDQGFERFIKTYYSSNLLGIDFDLEAGQSQDVINNLVQRVIVAQRTYPRLRFSFSLATLGGSSTLGLSATGVMVLNAIKTYGLSNYTINLMVMDYGAATPANCVIGNNGKCDMGKSANQAAINLHNGYGVPFSQIELTPMIGGNDVQDETFTLADVATMSNFAKQNNLAGVHLWSFDRDSDCAPGPSLATCNTYGQAGTLGFTNKFLNSLGF